MEGELEGCVGVCERYDQLGAVYWCVGYRFLLDSIHISLRLNPPWTYNALPKFLINYWAPAFNWTVSSH